MTIYVRAGGRWVACTAWIRKGGTWVAPTAAELAAAAGAAGP